MFSYVESAFASLLLTPEAGTIRYENVRCVQTDVFSYLIHYTWNAGTETVIVLRILHTSRQPIW